MTDYPSAARPGEPRGAGAAADPRRPGRPEGRRYDRARYVWDGRRFPQYYIPLADVAPGSWSTSRTIRRRPAATARRYGLRVGDVVRTGAARGAAAAAKVDGLDRHRAFRVVGARCLVRGGRAGLRPPRSPYTRVDAIRSTRTRPRRVARRRPGRVVSPVMCFETGLPTRYYLNRTDVDFSHLVRPPR